MTTARLAAARVLLAVDQGHTTLAAELERHRAGLEDDRDRALMFELAAGTLRWRNELDALLAACAARPVDDLDVPVRVALRLGAYQLTHLDRIPAHAVVNESVELTRGLGRARASGFVNAVLRRLSRGRPQGALPRPPESGASRPQQVRYLSITLSHPEWLVERWLTRFGFDAAQAWCRFNNESPAVTIRSIGRLTPQEILGALTAAGLDASPARWVEDALQLAPGSSGRLPPDLAAEVTVQDEGSQLVARVVRAAPGERVFDACAAPGGKTIVMATDARGQAAIVAADSRPTRLRLLRALLGRAGVVAPMLQIDARRPLPFDAVFDAVLLDAPCSGVGTLRRDPDLKWSRNAVGLAEYAIQQAAMLAQAACIVRPGGRLVYATCSSEPEENEAVVDAFLASHLDFSIRPAVPEPSVADADALVDARGFLRTLPFRDGLDAFYAALLVRRPAA